MKHKLFFEDVSSKASHFLLEGEYPAIPRASELVCIGKNENGAIIGPTYVVEQVLYFMSEGDRMNAAEQKITVCVRPEPKP